MSQSAVPMVCLPEGSQGNTKDEVKDGNGSSIETLKTLLRSRSAQRGEGSSDDAGAAKRQKVSTEKASTEVGANSGLMNDAAITAFTCGICQDIFYDCVAVAPCQHNFCNVCFSEWHNTSLKKGEQVSCPECRGIVSSAARNPTIRSLVEAYLAMHPERQRSPEEKAQLDKDGLIKATPLVIQKSGGGAHGTDSESDFDSDYDSDSDFLCLQCPRATESGPQPTVANGFQCPPGVRHMACSQCMQLVPARPECADIQKCSICSRYFCDSYFRSQGHAGCSDYNPVKLTKLVDMEVTEMPPVTFGGNLAEQEVTAKYMEEKDLSVKEVMASCLEKLDSGEFALPRIGLMVAPGAVRSYPPVPPTPVTSASTACKTCADVVTADLFYLYRRAISTEELPREAASRQDCWYGRECRTQFHNIEHGKRLNHVCELNVPNRAGHR